MTYMALNPAKRKVMDYIGPIRGHALTVFMQSAGSR